MDYNSLMMCSISGDELQKAKQTMIESVNDWVLVHYPNIRLPQVERNLATLVELKKYDDSCKGCMSIRMCPGGGYKMVGVMMPDGVINWSMVQCPGGLKPEKHRNSEASSDAPIKAWTKRKSNQY